MLTASIFECWWWWPGAAQPIPCRLDESKQSNSIVRSVWAKIIYIKLKFYESERCVSVMPWCFYFQYIGRCEHASFYHDLHDSLTYFFLNCIYFASMSGVSFVYQYILNHKRKYTAINYDCFANQTIFGLIYLDFSFHSFQSMFRFLLTQRAIWCRIYKTQTSDMLICYTQ